MKLGCMLKSKNLRFRTVCKGLKSRSILTFASVLVLPLCGCCCTCGGNRVSSSSAIVGDSNDLELIVETLVNVVECENLDLGSTITSVKFRCDSDAELVLRCRLHGDAVLGLGANWVRLPSDTARPITRIVSTRGITHRYEPRLEIGHETEVGIRLAFIRASRWIQPFQGGRSPTA